MASALLLASGTTGLAALQSLSIAMGIFRFVTDILKCKGAIYALLVTVACFSLHQGLESTLTGRSKETLALQEPPCLTPHILDPLLSQPYSQLNFHKVRLSILASFKVNIDFVLCVCRYS